MSFESRKNLLDSSFISALLNLLSKLTPISTFSLLSRLRTVRTFSSLFDLFAHICYFLPSSLGQAVWKVSHWISFLAFESLVTHRNLKQK